MALLSATIATVLGTLGALSLARRHGVMAGLLQSLFLAPLVFPTIILGLALLLLYKTVGMPVFPRLLLAHCVIGMPYCFRTVLASVAGRGRTEPWRGAGQHAFPDYPAVDLAGRPLGLAVRVRGVVRRIEYGAFLSGPGLTTLPIEIFSYLQFQGSLLVIAAASTLQIALIIAMVAGIERVVGLGRIVRSR